MKIVEIDRLHANMCTKTDVNWHGAFRDVFRPKKAKL
jgi:hypothetical protein